MKAVMYGGGNIGRGFIGTLFSASGYETVFVDVVDAVVNTLNQECPQQESSQKTDSCP